MKRLFVLFLFGLMIVTFVSCSHSGSIFVWNEGGDTMTVTVDQDSKTVEYTYGVRFDLEWRGGLFESHDAHLVATFSGSTKQGGRHYETVTIEDGEEESVIIEDCPGWTTP